VFFIFHIPMTFKKERIKIFLAGSLGI
jgi:hypothetical protein